MLLHMDASFIASSLSLSLCFHKKLFSCLLYKLFVHQEKKNRFKLRRKFHLNFYELHEKRNDITLAYSLSRLRLQRLNIYKILKDSSKGFCCMHPSSQTTLSLPAKALFSAYFYRLTKTVQQVELRKVSRKIITAVAALLSVFSNISILVNKSTIHNNVIALQLLMLTPKQPGYLQ